MNFTAQARGAEEAFASSELQPIAHVVDSEGSLDLAFQLPSAGLLLVRCVDRCRVTDYDSLGSMLREGDFDRAVLVYCDREGSVLSGEIETWHIDDVERLAAKLALEAAS